MFKYKLKLVFLLKEYSYRLLKEPRAFVVKPKLFFNLIF
jgi:hypothetical protein